MKKFCLVAMCAAVFGWSSTVLLSVSAQEEDAGERAESRERAEQREVEERREDVRRERQRDEEREEETERRRDRERPEGEREEGEGEERARDLERRRREEREVGEQRERAENQERTARARAEFARHVQEKRREIEELSKSGRSDDARKGELELRKRAEELAREHGEHREQQGQHGERRGEQGEHADHRPQGDRREHLDVALGKLHEAAEHLQAAGFPDQAHEIREHSGELGRHLRQQLMSHEAEHRRQPDGLEARVNELAEQMEHVRRALEAISARLERD